MQGLLKDRDFFRNMLRIALPIALQQLLISSVNMLDVLMVGQIGEDSIAAVGLANQIYFLMALLVYGVSSGVSVFAAQYWGKRDIPNVRRVLGISLTVSLSAAVIYTLAAQLIPTQLLSLYTTERDVITLGVSYLRIASLSYVFYVVTAVLNMSMRATEDVAIPTTISVITIVLKILLNYGLILGHFGLPALGVTGAAIGTLVAHVLESIALVIVIYARKRPQAATLKQLFDFDGAYFRRIFRIALPAMINEIFWSLGVTIYNGIYAHISTDAIAAVQIVGTIENLAFVVFLGLGNACGVMVGNKIGAGHEDEAQTIAARFRIIVIIGASLLGGLLILLREPILSLYNISPAASANAMRLMLFSGLILWQKASNFLLFIGILRAGGDTRYALLLETLVIWLIAIPLGLLGAFVLDLPVHWVYLMISSEELIKFTIGSGRFRSGRWLNNLVSEGEAVAA